MKYKDKELIPAKLNRVTIREASAVLRDMTANESAIQDLILEQTDIETAQKLASEGQGTVADYLGKNKDLTKKLIELQRSYTPEQRADNVYRLFVVSVDKTGWTDEEVADFAGDNLDTYDYAEVESWVNSFRERLPK